MIQKTLFPTRNLYTIKIQEEQLKAGDHIYTWRNFYSYTHHGRLLLPLLLYLAYCLLNFGSVTSIHPSVSDIFNHVRIRSYLFLDIKDLGFISYL